MKFVQKRIPFLLVVGITLGWMIVQTPSIAQPPEDVMAPGLAEGELPPGLQELEDRRAEGEANAPQRRGPKSRDDVLASLRNSKGGPPGLAEGELPPGLQKIEERRAEGEANAPQRRGPRSRDDILTSLRNRPGGPPGLAEGELPPGLQELEDRRAEGEANAGRGPIDLEELLDKVRSLPGGEERLNNARGGRQGMITPEEEELLDKVRSLPGGEERLNNARGGRQGMITPEESGYALSELVSPALKALAWFNPFQVAAAHAQPGFSVWVDKSNGWSSFATILRGYGSVSGEYYGTTAPYLYLYGTNFNNPGGPGSGRPFANSTLSVNVPSDGWYIVNFEAFAGNDATLEHYNFLQAPGGFGVVTTAWGGYSKMTQNFPVLIQLGAGNHFLKFKTENYSFIYGAGVYSL